MSASELVEHISSPTLFAAHPLPNTNDPFAPLLSRYFSVSNRPVRSYGQPSSDVEVSRSAKHWRQAADGAAELICKNASASSSTAETIRNILTTWVLRFQCLAKLHLMSILANESSALISYLPPFFPAKPLPPYNRREIFFNTFVPFELILFYAILPMHLGGDRHAVVEELQDIVQGCKREYFRSQDSVWKERMEETGLAMAGVLVEMGELSLAAKLLMDLAKQQDSIQAYKAAFLVYLEMGLVTEAGAVLQTLKDSKMAKVDVLMLDAVYMLAIGDASGAENKAREAEELKTDQAPVKGNLSSIQLYTGKLSTGVKMLQELAAEAPKSFYNEETLLSNLVTLQEMQAGNAFTKKLDILRQATRWSNEGVRIASALRI